MTEQLQHARPAGGRRPVRPGRVIAWVAGAAVVALAVGGGIAVPVAIQAQRVQEHAALAAERDAARAALARERATLQAAIALEVAQRQEVRVLVDGIRQLGQVAEPILAAEHAKALTDAGAMAIEIVGEADPELPEERAAAHALLVQATESLTIEDARAREEAEAAGADPPEAVAPTSFLLLDILAAERIIGAEPEHAAADAVPDEQVTDALIEATRAELTTIDRERSRLDRSLRLEEVRLHELQGAVAPALAALRFAAEGAEGAAALVVEQTTKAPDAAAAVTTTAQRAQEAGAHDSAMQLLDGLTAYVEAARAAQDAHAQAVEAERVAAEAAAAAAAAAAASRPASSGSGGGGSRGPRLCARYRADFGGGASLVLVPC